MNNVVPQDGMGFFIEVKDGKTINHPISGWNLKLFFPDFDPENPPEPFQKFLRKHPPRTGPLKVCTGVTYELENGVWTDVFQIEPIPESEQQEKIQQFITNNPKPFPSWVLNLDYLWWEAPVSYPDNGQEYYWNEKLLNWMTEAEYADFVANDPDQLSSIMPLGDLDTPADLPQNYNGIIGDGYFIKSEGALFVWDGKNWIKLIKPETEFKLKDQIIIDARLNDQQVRILGVVSTVEDLDINFTGEVADGYIIDSINKVYAWTGTNWVEADLKISA